LKSASALIRCAAVVRCRILLPPICASIFVLDVLFAQQSDEIRQRPVEIRSAEVAESPTPGERPTPKKKSAGRPQSSSTASPGTRARAKHRDTSDAESKAETPAPQDKPKTATTKAKPSETPAADEETPKPKKPPASSKGKKKKTAHGNKATPAKGKSPPKKKANPAGEETPEASPKRAQKPAETPTPRPSASSARALTSPKPSAPPAPPPLSGGVAPAVPEEPEQLTIEKSGYEKPRTFWQRVFGGSSRGGSSSGAGYRYLSRSVRTEIDRVGADRRNPRWQLIVVHNSGTRQGNARVFDYYHRHVRHMQNGLAYHFVIGNGTSTGNGEIEVGDRWRRQINGGHVHSDYLNNIAIGICLVGDFNRDQPTRAQLECCEELVRYLRQRCGKIENHFPLVKPHREVNPPRWATDCPGDAFPYSWFRRFRE
jgi:hypothetical protein